MTKSISITCKTSELVEIAKLERFQGDLKEITPEAMDKLKASIIKYGFSFPIFVWQTKILDGHQRLEAAKQLIKEGYVLKSGKLPVVQISADSDQEAAEKLLLINSRYAQMTQAGFDAFVTDFDIDLSDFSGLLEIPEIYFDFDGGGGFDGNTDPDDVPDVQPDVVSKRGDIWILGEHRLMCGDSTLIDDVEALMAGGKADIRFTSPPYGLTKKTLQKHGKNRNRTVYDGAYDDTQIIDFINLLSLSEQFADTSAINIQFLSNNKQQFIDYLYSISEKIIDIMVWFKHTTAPNANSSILSRGYEFLIIYQSDKSDHVFIPYSDWHGTVNNVIDIDSRRWAEYRQINQATMPIQFSEYVIDTVFNLSRTVLDPFSGTGTTMIACQKLGRKSYSLEISPQYCDVSIRRWQDFTGQQAVLESTGEKFDDIPARHSDNDK